MDKMVKFLEKIRFGMKHNIPHYNLFEFIA